MSYSDCYMMFGIGGLLGNTLYLKLSSMTVGYRVFAFDRPRANIANEKEVSSLIKYIKPTVIFNCAALSDLELCEEAKESAYAANSVGPRIIAAEAKKVGAKVVHFSSPYVFDGTRSSSYSEKCATNPINFLGKTRLEGEQAVLGESKNNLIIRPGWLFGEDGKCDIFKWLRCAQEDEQINIREDEIGSPTYALDLVDATMELVKQKQRGIFHISNLNTATWSVFAHETLRMMGTKANIKTIPSEALRMEVPLNTVLSSRKYTVTTGNVMRPWDVALKDCLTALKKMLS